MHDIDRSRENGSLPKKRRRPPLSCVTCRRRKIKCDRNQPCNHCLQSKHFPCEYNSSSVVPENPDSGVHSVDQESTRSSEVDGRVDDYDRAMQSRAGSGASSSREARRLSKSDSAMARSCARAPPDSLSEGYTAFSRSQTHEASQCVVRRGPAIRELFHQPQSQDDTSQETSMGLKGVYFKNRLVGPSHFMAITPHFTTLHSCFHRKDFINGTSATGGNPTGPGRGLVDKVTQAKDVARELKRVYLKDAKAGIRASLPDRNEANQLVERYFATYEPVYRILHRPTFDASAEAFWAEDSTVSECFVIQYSLVLAIALGMAEKTRPLEWYRGAHTWFGGPHRQSKVRLALIQTQCLLLLAQSVLYIGPTELLAMSTASVIRNAQAMGLHRDPSCFSKMSCLEAEIRRRVWGTLVELDIQHSLDMGLAPSVSVDDYDAQPPSNFDDEDLDSNVMMADAIPHPASTCTDTTYQEILVQTTPIRLSIVKTINHFRSRPGYDDIVHKGTRLQTHLQSVLSRHTQIEATSSTKSSRTHADVVEVLIRRCILALHGPFAIKAPQNPQFYLSRKICLDQCLVISSKIRLDPPSRLTELMCHGSLFHRVIITLAAYTNLELITQAEEDCKNMTMGLNRVHRDRMRTAVHTLLDVLEARLRIDDFNVKGLMFIRMGLGQSNAIETSADLFPSVFKAGNQGLDKGIGYLRDRLAVFETSTGASAGTSDKTNVPCESIPSVGLDYSRKGLTDDMVSGNGTGYDSIGALDVDGLVSADLVAGFDLDWLFPQFDNFQWT